MQVIALSKRNMVVLGLLLLVLVAVLLSILELFSSPSPRSAVRQTGDGIGLISIEGVITAGSGGFWGAGQGDYLLSELRRAGADPIRALVVRINSPGGSAAASQELYRELQKVREKGKIVVVSMGDLAASGGYMVACAADYIMANPASLTGSIGVIIDATSYEGLYDLLGIEYEVIKSGQFKDILNPARSLTPEERALLGGMIEDIFEQFVATVMEGRGLEREKVLPYADGRLLTGRQALEAGLVDELGNLYDAIDRAARLASISGEPRLYHYGVRQLFGFRLPGLQLDLKGILPLLARDSLFWY